MLRAITPLHYQVDIANPLMLIRPPYKITDNDGTTLDLPLQEIVKHFPE